MLALGLGITLLVALFRAACARHAIAVVGVLVLAYALGMDGANGLARRVDGGHALEGFIVIFLGPSAAFGRAQGALPTTEWLVGHPVMIHVAAVLACAALVVWLHRQVTPMRPESSRARALDGIALPLIFVGAMETILLVMLGLMARLVGA